MTRTLRKIKNNLPKWILLEPTAPLKDGDEVTAFCIEGEPDEEYVRRAVPDEVLDNQAFWVLHSKLATVPASYRRHVFILSSSHQKGEPPFVTTDVYGGGFAGFESEQKALEAIPLLGGKENIVKRYTEGDMMSYWLGEQLV